MKLLSICKCCEIATKQYNYNIAITICYVGISAVANGNQQRDKRKNNLDECFLRAKCRNKSTKYNVIAGMRRVGNGHEKKRTVGRESG